MILCLLIAAVIIVSILWGLDNYLEIKDIEKDLKLYLGDVLIARDLSDKDLKVHWAAVVSSVKTLIRKHFDL